MEDKETREQAKRKNEVQVQKAKKGSQEGRKETNEKRFSGCQDWTARVSIL